jgi:putative ABC transport system permease protein
MFSMAWRETRGAWRHFVYFLVCVAVGVSALVSISLFATHVEHAVSKQAKGLLGGDLEIRSSHPLSEESRAVVDSLHQRAVETTHVTELVAMAARPDAAGSGNSTQIVELKAVDPGYPLYGVLKVEPALPLERLLHPDPTACGGCEGVLVQEALLLRMNVRIGDRLKLGKADFVITGLVRTEPDRMANAFSLGPRVIVSHAGLQAAGLVQRGSRVRERQLLRLPSRMALEPLRAELRGRLAADPCSSAACHR